VRQAFTLVESLIVITIVVVLLAMMTPAINRAISHATRARCLATLHAWHMGFHLYAQDHKGAVVQYTPNSLANLYPWGEMWWDRLAPYMGSDGWGKDRTRPQGLLAPMHCPATTVQIARWNGTATETWAWNLESGPGGVRTETPGSYTLSGWMATTYDTTWGYSKFTRAPGRTPVLAEGWWIDAWPNNTEPPPPNINTSGDADHVWRLTIARHGRAINLFYVDGSAATIPLGDLWLQQWNKTTKANSNYTGDYFQRNYPGDY
jgi:prepilin-type N-terminal cleavage/methylation domain-containing protein/prepilin-type processing-associated H-X9-DG protein